MGLPCTGLSYIIISEMTRVVSDFAYWFGRASSLFSILLQMYRLEKLFYKHDLFYSVFYFFFYVLLYEPVNTILRDSISHTLLSPKSDQYQISPCNISAL